MIINRILLHRILDEIERDSDPLQIHYTLPGIRLSVDLWAFYPHTTDHVQRNDIIQAVQFLYRGGFVDHDYYQLLYNKPSLQLTMKGTKLLKKMRDELPNHVEEE